MGLLPSRCSQRVDARSGQEKERALGIPHGDLFHGADLFRELKLRCLTFKIKVTPCFFAVITFLFHRIASWDRSQFPKCPAGTAAFRFRAIWQKEPKSSSTTKAGLEIRAQRCWAGAHPVRLSVRLVGQRASQLCSASCWREAPHVKLPCSRNRSTCGVGNVKCHTRLHLLWLKNSEVSWLWEARRLQGKRGDYRGKVEMFGANALRNGFSLRCSRTKSCRSPFSGGDVCVAESFVWLSVYS